jgi:beta-N-acetylhexosaminidase
MKQVQDMDLYTKVAQLYTFYCLDSALDDSTRRLVTQLKAGGIFLPSGGLIEPEQVHQLTSALQKVSIEEGSGIPLFISADFVAGAGCKLKSGAVHFPKNRAIGATRDRELAYASGRMTAEESLAMGVNFNYSPVMDINNNPLNPVIGTHSFGEERELVSELGCAVIQGYQDYGLIATAKHFPGHGDTHIDSHEDLPVLPFDRDRLERFELEPFRRAIAAGVDAIMVGHMAVPALDPSLKPASLSYEITTRLLREEMGFQGLIVTDGLSMKGITNQYSLEEACVQGIAAGADILLASAHSYEQAASMLNAVLEAVNTGILTEARIDESVERILRIKQKYNLTAEAYTIVSYDPLLFNQPPAQEVSRAIAWKAATPIRNLTRGWIQDQPDELWQLVRDETTALFAEQLRRTGVRFAEHIAEGHEGVASLLSGLKEMRNVIAVLSHNKPLPAHTIQQLDALLSSSPKSIWIHFGSEYDVEQASVPCLLMYDRAPSLQHAAARYLTDKRDSL